MGVMEHLPRINSTLKGLAAVVDNQPAVLRFFARNWPVTVLAGAALTGRMMQRHKKKELSAYNVLVDVGSIIGPVASLFLVVKLAQESEQKRAESDVQSVDVKGLSGPMKVPYSPTIQTPTAIPLASPQPMPLPGM